MLQLYYHPSPNPLKIALYLEEAQLPYELVPIDTRKGEPGEQATMFFMDPSGNAIEIKAFANLDSLFAK